MKDFFKGRILLGDTETTGLSAEVNRLFEIALVEVVDGKLTGRVFHELVDPGLELEDGAKEVTGQTREDIRGTLIRQGKYHGPKIDIEKTMDLDKIKVQKFEDIADSFLEFVGDSPLMFHNEAYDRQFIDNEMVRLERPKLSETNEFYCSLLIANNHPTRQGRRNTLQQLAQDYKVDLSERDVHSALVDTKILYGVVKSIFEEKRDLGIGLNLSQKSFSETTLPKIKIRKFDGAGRLPVYEPSEDEANVHKKMMGNIKSKSGSDIELTF